MKEREAMRVPRAGQTVRMFRTAERAVLAIAWNIPVSSVGRDAEFCPGMP